MGLPRAVVEANERADALMAQRANQGTPPAAAPEQQQAAPAPQTAPAAQVAAPAGDQAPNQAAAPAPAAPQTPAFESTWEQRFKVLDGKYRAEVPRLHGEIKDLKASVSNLQAELAAAKSAPQTPRVTFTDAEREQFGDELLNVVARVAAQSAPAAAAPQVDLTPVTERMARLEQHAAETAEDAFFRKLAGKVPHYAAQNVDAGFVKWLAETDSFTGRVRQDLFNEAYDALDVNRIAAFFTAYPYQSTVAQTGSNVPSLESQVAPDVSRSAPPTPPGQKIWTRPEIDQFYMRVRRGEFTQNPDEMVRIEQDIFAAQKDKRIR